MELHHQVQHRPLLHQHQLQHQQQRQVRHRQFHQAPTPTPVPPSESLSVYNLTGFAAGNTGGGNIAETDARYKKVYNATDLAVALKKNSGFKVVEIMNDLDLGWNEIPAAAQVMPFVANNPAQTHPVLMTTGVSKIYIDGFNGLTIFSANGAKIKHASLDVKYSSNLIIRNLEFDDFGSGMKPLKVTMTKTIGII